MSDRYRELRKQLAELGRSFFRAAKQFPASYYDFIDANSRLPYGVWQRWIDDNRNDDDLQRERWDRYPAGWALDHDVCDELLESECTRNYGVLRSQPVTLNAAQVELERLGDDGIKILLAIRREARQSKSLDELAVVPKPLPDGHRGWLDIVRRTAESNRGTNLKVDYRLFPGDSDRRSQIIAIRKAVAETCQTPEQYKQKPDGFSACRVTPDIFSASANAISIWLQGEKAEPIVALVSPGITIPRLLSPDDGDYALEILHGNNSRHDQRLPVPSTPKQKRKAGRPRVNVETQSRDCRLFDASRTGIPRSELVREFDLSAIEVGRAIERERKRRERSRKKRS